MAGRFRAVLSVALLAAGCSRVDPPPLVISQSSAGAYEAALRARDGGFVAAWYDTRDGNAEIYRRLLDESGRPAGPERRLTNNPEDSYEPSLAVTGDAVVMAWYEKDADGLLVARVGAWSFDGSRQWERTLASKARNPVLATDGRGVFCAWIAAAADGQEAVWGAWIGDEASDPVPILIGPVGKTTWNLNAIAVAPRAAIVVYDAVAGTRSNEIFLADVTPSGSRLVQLTADDGVPSKYPDIASGEQQALTWFDRRDGNDEVYLRVGSPEAIRDPAGPSLRVTTTPGESIGAYLAWARNGRLGLAWSDNTEGQHEVYFQEFAGDGHPRTDTRRVTTNSSSSWVPAIVPLADGYALAWNEYVAAAGDGHQPATSQISFTIVR